MPWQEVLKMDPRREFVRLALQEGANRRELCRRFAIHPDTGYKWLERWGTDEKDLADRSRRPHTSPGRTQAKIETAILSVRDAHSAWGARKIARCLERDGTGAPAISAVHAVLRRHGPQYAIIASFNTWQLAFKISIFALPKCNSPSRTG